MVDYVNPFGGYAQGYTQGSELEDRLQQNARQARQEDWQSKYINPLTLAAAQRADTLGAYRLPYEESATNDASVESRARAAGAALDTGTKFAVATRDPSGIDTAGRYYLGPNFQGAGPEANLRGADFERSLDIANAQANEFYRQALGDRALGQNQTALGVAAIRSNPAATAQPGPASRLFPTAPAAPAVAPGATPPTPSDSESPGVNPQGSALTPFHQLDPVHQAHILHYTSQLTGHPIDAVAQHITKQLNPNAYSDPYNPGQTSNPNSADTYYHQPSGSQTNFATA